MNKDEMVKEVYKKIKKDRVTRNCDYCNEVL